MAIVTNTFQTFQAKGIREELSDVIYNIAPTDCPFMSNAGRGKVTNTFFEWQTDTLAAADLNNKQIEGDDLGSTFDAVVPTVRLGNQTQISRKSVVIAGTEEVVDKAGRKSELSYQIAKKSSELKRDMESILLSNQIAAVGATGTARTTGSLLAFIKSNTSIGSGGVNPVYTTQPTNLRTDGTQRALTETLLKDVIQQCWTAGATPSTVMVGALNKQVVSGFAGIATKTIQQTAAKAATIIGAADIYVSDFGTLSIVPNRFQRNRDAFVLDWEYVEVEYLRPFAQIPLAKTGDAEKRMLIVEYGLKVMQEAALGLVADLS